MRTRRLDRQQLLLPPHGVQGDTTPPYTRTLAGGTLPAGLTLAPNGQIAGSPATVSLSTFTVSVTDSTGKTATQQFSTNITLPPPLGPSGCAKISGQPDSVSASMTGPAIGGKTPSGQATLDESRITTCGGYSILNASINGVNLPDGTPMWFYFDGRLVGEVALVNGSAKWRRTTSATTSAARTPCRCTGPRRRPVCRRRC